MSYLITTKTGADQNGTSHVTYNFRLTSQMLGKRPELFGTHDYIDYQQYIGSLLRRLSRPYGTARSMTGSRKYSPRAGHSSIR